MKKRIALSAVVALAAGLLAAAPASAAASGDAPFSPSAVLATTYTSTDNSVIKEL